MKNKKAFSLIELSIVILIIGIIVAGIMGGRIISISALTKARTLTNSSPVAGIEDLIFWIETTSKNSFLSQPTNGSTVASWNNINPQLKASNNAIAVSAATYIENAMGNLPVLRFNGSSNYYTYDSTALNNTDYTIIVVEQRRSSATDNYFVGGGDFSVSNSTLHFGYKTNTSLVVDQFGNGVGLTMPSYSSPIARIHSFTHNKISGKKYYLNGALSVSSADIVPLSGYISGAIARYGNTSSFYNGDIGEIIMFNRSLSDFERLEIEKYLSKKWSIKLT